MTFSYRSYDMSMIKAIYIKFIPGTFEQVAQVKGFKDDNEYKMWHFRNDTSGWKDYEGDLKPGKYANVGSVVNPVWRKA